MSEPQSLIVRMPDGAELVRFDAGGRVVPNPEFSSDEIARGFWRAVEHAGVSVAAMERRRLAALVHSWGHRGVAERLLSREGDAR